MIIDQTLLDKLTAEAKASARLRMNYDLRNSEADGSQRMLNAIEEVCSFQAEGCGFSAFHYHHLIRWWFFSPERRKHPIRIDGSKKKGIFQQ